VHHLPDDTGTPAHDACSITITIPPFVDQLVERGAGALDDDEKRMRLAIALAQRNIEEGGGPFGAVVFFGDTPVAGGVNRVLESGLSVAHAEIVALMRAQKRMGTKDGCLPRGTTLVTSTDPCCQCFGAIVWSGITRLVCGATTADAEAIGFDEGPKPERWPETLTARGIEVLREVCRTEASAVLRAYRSAGRPLYGPGKGS
jgi:tRNA(Arg) A34 adenosine deaminase TadA